ncbi:hypothetical protein Pyn_23336 [Prunus yedoensis var. nudiflora]|uniref:Uncharacterized protein n=1 Tax=Prunus yedoensis var. nudiflora TaxID=2094558 RepID=A0A314ZUD3_PRUYE|nr:hypothetical protein Pyn_23336 [Prunus yedoensis var. nudiflora]
MDGAGEIMQGQPSSLRILTTKTRQVRTHRPLLNLLRHSIRMKPYEMKWRD